MSSEILKCLMVETAYHTNSYKFLYTELQRVIAEPSKGSTRVRFVSRSLRTRKDDRFKHVFLEFQKGTPMRKTFKKSDNVQVYVAEHAPKLSYVFDDTFSIDWKEELSIQLPNIEYDFDEIRDFDEKVSDIYLLGLQDCRHHTWNMLQLCYPLKTKTIDMF